MTQTRSNCRLPFINGTKGDNNIARLQAAMWVHTSSTTTTATATNANALTASAPPAMTTFAMQKMPCLMQLRLMPQSSAHKRPRNLSQNLINRKNNDLAIASPCRILNPKPTTLNPKNDRTPTIDICFVGPQKYYVAGERTLILNPLGNPTTSIRVSGLGV